MISIIIPLFNDRWNLKNLLEDLNNQTFKDFRAIFIDDGSTDNTKALFDSMKGKLLFRYKYFRTQNSGQAAARFFGYKHIESGTRFVTFVDGDDRIKNDYVRSLVENLMLYEADLSIVNYDLIENNKVHIIHPTLDTVRILTEDLPLEWISEKNFKGFLWGKMFKVELFDSLNWHTEMRFLEDVALINQIIPRVSKAVYSSIPQYRYIQRRKSSVRVDVAGEEWMNVIDVLDSMHSLINDKNVERAFTARCVRTLRGLFERSSLNTLKRDSNQISKAVCLMKYENKTNLDLDIFDYFFYKYAKSNLMKLLIAKTRKSAVFIKHKLKR